MKTQSTIKPPLSGFLIEQINGNKCNVHIYENVIYDGDIYEYDLYILENIPYHDRLGENIETSKTAWVEMAKGKLTPEPTIEERLQALETMELERILGGI